MSRLNRLFYKRRTLLYALSYSPAGPYEEGDVVTITCTFNRAVQDSPVPQIALTGANSLAKTNLTKSSTTVYTKSHTVQAGSGTVEATVYGAIDASSLKLNPTATSGRTFTVTSGGGGGTQTGDGNNLGTFNVVSQE